MTEEHNSYAVLTGKYLTRADDASDCRVKTCEALIGIGYGLAAIREEIASRSSDIADPLLALTGQISLPRQRRRRWPWQRRPLRAELCPQPGPVTAAAESYRQVTTLPRDGIL